jgi:hypothetical protein
MDPPYKPLSHMNFSMKVTQYICTLKDNHISAKKCTLFLPFQNGGLPIFISCHYMFGQKFKKHFPEGIFQRKSAQVSREI